MAIIWHFLQHFHQINKGQIRDNFRNNETKVLTLAYSYLHCQ